MNEFFMDVNNSWIIWPLLLWALFWKGWALWIAARKTQKIWYVALLVVNTLGLLEILYIFVFSKMKKGSEPEVIQPSGPKI
jgi:hypothetical protein